MNKIGEMGLSNNFLEELILDLQIEAEKLCYPKKDYSRQYLYLKKKHPKDYKADSFNRIEEYKCPKCSYFHSHLYIVGKKPKRCFRCHTVFNH